MGGSLMILSQVFGSDYAQVVDGVRTDKDVRRTPHPEHGSPKDRDRPGSVSWLEVKPR